jgi:metal-dependent amidase/aminoacylase/carboxypeptidase family protein
MTYFFAYFIVGIIIQYNSGEDMSYYLQRIPGAFFFVGSSPNALVADSLIPGGRYAGVESGSGSGSESAAETAAAAARVSRFQLPGLGGAPAGAIDTASTLLSATELRQSKLGTIVSHHMDTFDIDERALLIGASVLLEIALKDTV